MAKPQRGRAPTARSQATFSASCLKCKAASESSSQLTIKVPCGPISGLIVSLQLLSMSFPEDPLPFLHDL